MKSERKFKIGDKVILTPNRSTMGIVREFAGESKYYGYLFKMDVMLSKNKPVQAGSKISKNSKKYAESFYKKLMDCPEYFKEL